MNHGKRREEEKEGKGQGKEGRKTGTKRTPTIIMT